jgi:hypothetical protein
MNFYNIKRNIRNLSYNIKNIFQWSKILWNNFDWDYRFLLDIIQYKLERMNDYFSNANITTEETYKEMINGIQSCLDACHHLISRDFESDLIDNHYNKFPFSLDKGFSDEQRKSFDEMLKTTAEKEKKFSAQLFDGIRDNYKKWWD